MDHGGNRFRQNIRSKSPRDRSRSRSPREGKRNDRVDRGDRFRDSKVRLSVSNIPYETKWQDLKDLFREKVGSEITFVELFMGPDGKPTGTGVVEVKGRDVAKKAIEEMHRLEIKGRRIIVKEFLQQEEDDRPGKQQRINPSKFDRDMHIGGGGGGYGNMMGGGGPANQQSLAASVLSNAAAGLLGALSGAGGFMGNSAAANVLSLVGAGTAAAGGGLTGLNLAGSSLAVQQLLIQLGIDPTTITNQVFVANLDYKVTKAKMEEVFRIAGNVIEVDIKQDKDGRSRGMGTVRFEHPMEAVQAVALFNQQFLYDRPMAVRMDKWVDPVLQDIPNRMPGGLMGIGSGFGAGGQPLLNIAQISNTLTLCALTGQLTLPGANVGALPAASVGAGNVGVNAGMLGLNSGMSNLIGNLANLPGGASMMGNTSGSSSGNILQSGLSGSGGMGISDSNLLSSGLAGGGNFLGRLGGSSGLGGLQDVRGVDLPANAHLFNSSISGGVAGGLGASSDRFGMDRGAEYQFDHNSTLGNFDNGRMDRGSAAAGDGYGRSEAGGVNTVFVRNLPFSWTWQDLASKFKVCGDVRTANVKMDGGRSRGMGTVSFYTSDDARRAVDLMDGARLDGRQIEVRLDRMQ